MNKIVNIKTSQFKSDDGPVDAIVIGLNIPDAKSVGPFMRDVAEKFKLQRMISPPTTTVLLVTVVTEASAELIVKHWHEAATADKVVAFFMSQMSVADLVCGGVAGQTREIASLLAEAE